MILNIYKEKGWTSFDVVAKIRNTLRSRKIKVGHAGTLDPLAEGVLIVLTGSDTKNQDDFMKMQKEYVCEIAFGVSSETYDLEGPLREFPIPPNFNLEKELSEKLKKYLGEIEQIVPPYSAVKTKGKPLYKLAREGKMADVKLPTKKVQIYEIEVLDYFMWKDKPAVKLRVACGKGTYIRSLAHDLGEDFGIGGILVSLVRTKVGDYLVTDAKKIDKIEEILKV